MSNDPVESVIEDALISTGLGFRRGGHGEADFVLASINLEIECKQFYSERAVRQLAGKENIILVQGKAAAAGFVKLLIAAANHD